MTIGGAVLVPFIWPYPMTASVPVGTLVHLTFALPSAVASLVYGSGAAYA
jgi:hypothetical protein